MKLVACPPSSNLLAKRKAIPTHALVSSRCVLKTFLPGDQGFMDQEEWGMAADRTTSYYITSIYLSLLSSADIKVFSNFQFANMAAELIPEHAGS